MNGLRRCVKNVVDKVGNSRQPFECLVLGVMMLQRALVPSSSRHVLENNIQSSADHSIIPTVVVLLEEAVQLSFHQRQSSKYLDVGFAAEAK